SSFHVPTKLLFCAIAVIAMPTNKDRKHTPPSLLIQDLLTVADTHSILTRYCSSGLLPGPASPARRNTYFCFVCFPSFVLSVISSNIVFPSAAILLTASNEEPSEGSSA